MFCVRHLSVSSPFRLSGHTTTTFGCGWRRRLLATGVGISGSDAETQTHRISWSSKTCPIVPVADECLTRNSAHSEAVGRSPGRSTTAVPSAAAWCVWCASALLAWRLRGFLFARQLRGFLLAILVRNRQRCQRHLAVRGVHDEFKTTDVAPIPRVETWHVFGVLNARSAGRTGPRHQASSVTRSSSLWSTHA